MRTVMLWRKSLAHVSAIICKLGIPIETAGIPIFLSFYLKSESCCGKLKVG